MGTLTPRSRGFGRAAWLRDPPAKHRHVSVRQHEVDQLLACKLLLGKTKSKVRGMLGRPDNDSDGRFWRYITGAERGPIQLDPEELEVEFNPRERVVRARLFGG